MVRPPPIVTSKPPKIKIVVTALGGGVLKELTKYNVSAISGKSWKCSLFKNVRKNKGILLNLETNRKILGKSFIFVSSKMQFHNILKNNQENEFCKYFSFHDEVKAVFGCSNIQKQRTGYS